MKSNASLFWSLSILTLGLTALFASVDFYEYYNVAIKRNIADYPFGAEGPVAGIEHYKSAEHYAKHVLTMGFLAFALFGLALYWSVKRKTYGLIIIMTILISYMLINLVSEANG